jgi:hypothetical protein
MGYLPEGYLRFAKPRYQLIATATYLPEGHRRLRLWFAKPRFFLPSTFYRRPSGLERIRLNTHCQLNTENSSSVTP